MLTWDATDGASFAHYQIIRRNPVVIPFEPDRVTAAMMRAFLRLRSPLGQGFARLPRSAAVTGAPLLSAPVAMRLRSRRIVCGAAPATLVAGFFGVSKLNMRNAP